MTPKKFYKTILYMTAILMILSFILGYFIWSNLSNISKSAYEKEVYYNNFTSKVYALGNLERNYNKIKSDIKNIEFALPKTKNLDRLMTDLEHTAVKNNVEFNVYKYVDPNSKGKKKVEEIKELDLTQTVKQGDYLEMPFEITIEGRYGDVLNFVKEVEKHKRLILMKTVELTKIDQGEGSPTDAVKLVSSIGIYMKQ